MNRTSQSWQISDIHIAHNIIDYDAPTIQDVKNETEFVRMHFGLSGSYDFSCKQLNSSFSLSGHHHNIMYTDGLEMTIHNKSSRIETFGINFDTEAFIKIGQNGNAILQRFTDQIISKKNTILSPKWKTNNIRIQGVISEILNCSYPDQLRDLFLLSKSIELLVLQAAMYEKKDGNQFIKSKKDQQNLIASKEIITKNLQNPPTIIELSKLVGINEYKLKKGFKELFGTTIYGYIHRCRMDLAKRLLMDSDQSIKSIAFEAGYSSPQHFSNSFKKEFGVTPNSVRINPDVVIHGKKK